MRSIRLSLLEVRSRRSPRPIITPFPGFPHPSAGQSPRPSPLLPLPLCVCKRTRPGREETKARRDTRGRGKSVPWRPARGGWGGISIRSVSLPGWGGEVEGEVDDRRDPPRQIEINFTRITRRVACIYIHIYVFRFARILLSSLSLSLLQPFYCLLFSSVDPRLDSIRVRGWGGEDTCRGKMGLERGGEKCGCCWVIREDLFIGRFDESCICYLYWSVSLCTWLVRYI